MLGPDRRAILTRHQAGIVCYHRARMTKSKVATRLTDFFSQKGRIPGCYNEDEFLKLEREDPNVLERYAQHVLKVGIQENLGKEKMIAHAAEWVSQRLSTLKPQESRGLCRHASMTMVKVLESLDVWCFGVNGSLSVFAPPHPENPGYHFRIKDVEGKPGHTWVIAPPFMVIDATAKFQGWPNKVRDAVPPLLMEREPTVEPPLFERWVAPPLRAVPEFLRAFDQYRKELWTWLFCYRVEKAGANVHYLPGGVALPPTDEEADFTGISLSDIIREIRNDPR